jgi:hypothetical protein
MSWAVYSSLPRAPLDRAGARRVAGAASNRSGAAAGFLADLPMELPDGWVKLIRVTQGAKSS